MGIDPNPTRLLAKSFCGYWVSTLLARADLIKQIEGCDAAIPVTEDRDFFLRLSLVTSFVYVNKPLVRTDRSISPKGSKCRPWDDLEVRLRGQRFMLEKWLRMDAALPPDVRQAIVRKFATDSLSVGELAFGK